MFDLGSQNFGGFPFLSELSANIALIQDSAMAGAIVSLGKKTDVSPGRSSQTEIRESAANEFVFAVVGHVGSGTTEVAKLLKNVLTSPQLVGGPFDTEILKARDVLLALPEAKARLANHRDDTIEYTERLQDLGDSLRASGDHAAIAAELILRVRELRAKKLGITDLNGAIQPDGNRRAYIVSAARAPSSEVIAA